MAYYKCKACGYVVCDSTGFLRGAPELQPGCVACWSRGAGFVRMFEAVLDIDGDGFVVVEE